MTPFAVFADIDNTLTVRDHIIPQRNIDAVNEARRLGHKVFINTGRSFGNIPPVIFEQLEFDGVLSGNGTMITIGGKTVFEQFMPVDICRKLVRYFFENKNLWAAFEGKKRSYSIPGRPRKLSALETPVNSYEEFLEKSADDDIQVIAGSKDIGKDFLDSLSSEITYFTFDRYYDIVSAGNNKSHSMLMTLEMLGIPAENSIAFGDGDNDLGMLKAAGTGVAVANAQPELLKAADLVTLSNEEGGVGCAIEKLILKRG